MRPPRTWPAPASSRYGTWKWTELQMKTGGKPVYRYLYARPRPAYLGMPGQPAPRGRPAGAPAARGTSRRRPLRRDPVRHGQPRSGQALHLGARRLRSLQDDAGVLRELHQDRQPERPRAAEVAGLRADSNYQRMRIDVESRAEPEADRDRYLALDAAMARP